VTWYWEIISEEIQIWLDQPTLAWSRGVRRWWIDPGWQQLLELESTKMCHCNYGGSAEHQNALYFDRVSWSLSSSDLCLKVDNAELDCSLCSTVIYIPMINSFNDQSNWLQFRYYLTHNGAISIKRFRLLTLGRWAPSAQN